MGFVRYNKSNIPCQCGYPDGMPPLGRMVFPRAPPSGKPSSLGETFHHDTHTGMAYLYNVVLLLRCLPSLEGQLERFVTNKLKKRLPNSSQADYSIRNGDGGFIRTRCVSS